MSLLHFCTCATKDVPDIRLHSFGFAHTLVVSFSKNLRTPSLSLPFLHFYWIARKFKYFCFRTHLLPASKPFSFLKILCLCSLLSYLPFIIPLTKFSQAQNQPILQAWCHRSSRRRLFQLTKYRSFFRKANLYAFLVKCTPKSQNLSTLAILFQECHSRK